MRHVMRPIPADPTSPPLVTLRWWCAFATLFAALAPLLNHLDSFAHMQAGPRNIATPCSWALRSATDMAPRRQAHPHRRTDATGVVSARRSTCIARPSPWHLMRVLHTGERSWGVAGGCGAGADPGVVQKLRSIVLCFKVEGTFHVTLIRCGYHGEIQLGVFFFFFCFPHVSAVPLGCTYLFLSSSFSLSPLPRSPRLFPPI